jgi:DNA-directed RNA polymerase subunit RPC12/RpoP
LAAPRFRCAHCGHTFGEEEALCEDWTDPSRSFLCPACGERLVRAERVAAQLVPAPLRLRVFVRRWQKELVLAFAVLCAALLTEPMWGDRAAVGVLGLGTLGIVLRVLLGDGAPIQETLPATLVDAERLH